MRTFITLANATLLFAAIGFGSVAHAESSGRYNTEFVVCCGVGISFVSLVDADNQAADKCARLCRCEGRRQDCATASAGNFEYTNTSGRHGVWLSGASCTCTLQGCEGAQYMNLREEDEEVDPICPHPEGVIHLAE